MQTATQRENLLKNKNGFTLIELLGVIIILGIIIVITIPIVLNLIDKAKQGIIIDSAYGYKEAINKFYITKLIDDNLKLDGTYMVNNGKLGKYDIPINGIVPSSGYLHYENNVLNHGCLIIDKYYLQIEEKNIAIVNSPCNLTQKEKLSIDTTSQTDRLYPSSISTETGRFIYRGNNPNNYIWLDENGDGINPNNGSELYRIISFEPDGTTKVIKDKSIGSMSWDIGPSANSRNNDDNSYCNYPKTYYGCNVWGNQFNTYFNNDLLLEVFYYKKHLRSGTVIKDASLNTFLNINWINNTYLSRYIVDYTFNIGGIDYSSKTEKTLAEEKQEQANYKWIGKIGLMNVTDMVESSLYDKCTSVYSNKSSNLSESKEWPCTNNNWLFKHNEWFITPSLANTQSYVGRWVWRIQNGRFYSIGYASDKLEVRPTFYLRPDLKLAGSGTEETPYFITNY